MLIDRLPERFELRGDLQAVVHERQAIWRRLMRRELESVREDAVWSQGFDRVRGEPVRVAPRGSPQVWAREVEIEARARRVAAAGPIAGVVPVLHVGPGIVYAMPPASRPRPRLGLADAAACALMACEVVARVHALGLGGGDCLCFGPSNLRIVESAGGWRIAWLVPGQATLDAIDRLGLPVEDGRFVEMGAQGDPVGCDRRRLALLFASLLADGEFAEEREAVLAAGAERGDVAGLARLLLWFVADPGDWTARVDAMPVVRRLSGFTFDWDVVIAEGEELLAGGSPGRDAKFVALPLAAAYHQRAWRRCAAGEPAAALVDVLRALALDDWCPYRTTQATLLDRLGREEEAREVIAAAVAVAEQQAARVDFRGRPMRAPAGLARALATRGLLALKQGQHAAAEEDLRRAVALAPEAGHQHALGAVLYARGALEEAALWEARAVEQAPEVSRYRRALASSLWALGRVDAAREQARELLRQTPDDADLRVRFAGLLGGEFGGAGA